MTLPRILDDASAIQARMRFDKSRWHEFVTVHYSINGKMYRSYCHFECAGDRKYRRGFQFEYL